MFPTICHLGLFSESESDPSIEMGEKRGRKRVRRDRLPTPDVNLDAHHTQRSDVLLPELLSLTAGRPAIAKLTATDIVTTSGNFALNGVNSPFGIKNVRSEACGMYEVV